MKGGSLRPQEIQDFLQASYEEIAPESIDDYELDDKLSNLYGKVYVNHDLKKSSVSLSRHWDGNLGTDWINNLIFAISDPGYKLTPRYQTALKMYTSAMKKYKGFKFELLGHSQSGVIVNNICSDKVRNYISYIS